MIRLFHVYVPTGAFLYAVLEFLLVSAALVLATYTLIDVDPYDYLVDNNGGFSILAVAVVLILGFYFQDLYLGFHVASRMLLLQQLCTVTGFAFLVQGLTSYLWPDLRVPIRIMLVGSLLAMSGIFLTRVLLSNYAIQVTSRAKLLLVGASPTLQELDEYVARNPEAGLQIAGYVQGKPDSTHAPDHKILGELHALREIVEAVKPIQVVLGFDALTSPELTNDLLNIQYAGYDIATAAGAYERICGKVSIYALNPARIASQEHPRRVPGKILFVRLANSGMALIAMAVALPFMLVIVLELLVTGSGPILERQRRTGLAGKIFVRYRFRVNPLSSFARVIQRWHLDALPQLLNVLKGEMTFVGPESDKPEYIGAIEQYIPYYRERYMVSPGMTGWAQVHWTDESIPPDTISRLEYDLYYVRNASLSLDTLILLHTCKKILTAS